MPNLLLVKAANRVPGLKRLPVAKVLVAGELLMLARQHVGRLEPAERRRFLALVRRRRGNLTQGERAELARLVTKANPRLFVGLAADKLSPVPLPRRVVRGPKKRRTRA
jgi:hypothetical protein